MRSCTAAGSIDASSEHSNDTYLSLRALAAYAGLSVRTLRDRLAHPTQPLPHYRVGCKILVKRSEFDAWMRAFRASANHHLDDLVTDVLRSL